MNRSCGDVRDKVHRHAGSVPGLHRCLHPRPWPSPGRERPAAPFPGQSPLRAPVGAHAGASRPNPPPAGGGAQHRGAPRPRRPARPTPSRTHQILCAEELADYGLEYFHMVDCVHGNDSCKHLRENKPKRDELQRRLIPLIGKYAEIGFSFSFDEKKFQKLFRSPGFLPNSYPLCCWLCVTAVTSWITAQKIQGRVSFLFESGHQHQPDATRILHNLFGKSQAVSYSFVPKTCSGAVQAADVLAYLHAKHIKEELSESGRPTRKGFAALIGAIQHYVMLANKD